MNCPICGANIDAGTVACPICGADMTSFAGVPQDKIIVNQSEAQHMAAGDDTVTQLIPENYMQSVGDDTVTQLIPENYMQAQGDDTATVMLDPNQAQQYMPNQQQSYAQPAFQQAQGYAQQGFNQQANSYQQPQPGYQQAYQPNYQQRFNPSAVGGVKKQSPLYKGVSLATLVLLVVTIISCLIFMIKPIYYTVESFVGGAADEELIEEAMEMQGDEEETEEANNAYRIFVVIAVAFLLIATINALVCFMKINAGCIKSPNLQAVGAFIFTIVGAAVIIGLNLAFKEAIGDGLDYGDFSPSEAKKFNVYELMYVLGVASIVVSFVNIITSAMAKKSAR